MKYFAGDCYFRFIVKLIDLFILFKKQEIDNWIWDCDLDLAMQIILLLDFVAILKMSSL
jgi:hypothetical protein